MNKKILIKLILIVLVVFLIYIKITNYSTALKLNWDIKLPPQARMTEIYENSAEPSFHGDGIRYHIFSYKNEEVINKMFNWNKEEKETFFCDSYSECIDSWLNEIETPKEYFPDYHNCVYWYNKKDGYNEIIILWNKEENKIYVVESFV